MKKLLGIFAIATIVAACNGNAKTNSQAMQNTKNYRDSVKLDSFKRAEAVETEIDKREAIAKTEAAAALAAKSSARVTTTHVHKYTSAANNNSVQTRPAKKGWSSAAKGAAIGAGAGAITGILVDKKDGRGAVIGGVVGAGTGYVIGRAKDRKTGRVQ